MARLEHQLMTCRVRYLDPHTRREMLSPPEIGFVAAVLNRYRATFNSKPWMRW
jgi:hypothetical protein